MKLVGLLLGMVMLASGAADAQEEPLPQTVPADIGFGQNKLARGYEFPDESKYLARADRRDAIDASSDRLIIWPSAHTPHRRTLAFSNHMLFLSQVSYSPTDDLQLTGSLVLPIAPADTHAALSAKLTLSESDNHVFSIQPFGQYRQGRRDGSNSDFGLGLTALADLVISNNLIVTLGAVGYATLAAGAVESEYENCESRSDYLDGTCLNTTRTVRGFPSGGHFIGGQVGATWYILDSLSLRMELMSGIAAGSVLGSEWVTRDVSTEDEAERFEQGPAAVGLPYGTDVTAGMGLQWSNGLVAMQFSGYVLRAPIWWDPEGGESDFYLVPMLNVGLALF